MVYNQLQLLIIDYTSPIISTYQLVYAQSILDSSNLINIVEAKVLQIIYKLERKKHSKIKKSPYNERFKT